MDIKEQKIHCVECGHYLDANDIDRIEAHRLRYQRYDAQGWVKCEICNTNNKIKVHLKLSVDNITKENLDNLT